MIKKILLILLGILIAIQFIPVDFTNPPVQIEKDFFTLNEATPEITQLIKSSCYDCHSNETKYPNYSKIAPINFWLKDHIVEGRDELNFSTWGDYEMKKQKKKLKECAEEMEENEMPLDSYTWTHGEARLTAEQKTELVSFFKQLNSSY